MTARNFTLDRDLDDFGRELNTCVEMILRRYATMYADDPHPGIAPATVREWFDEPLPAKGMPVEQLLTDIDETVMRYPVLNLGTKMFAYVMSGGNQVSVMADLLAAALNQNVAKWHLAPAMTEIERRVIHWTADFIGLAQHRAGAMVSSGSAANLAGLTIARNLFAEARDVRARGLFGLQPMIVYASTQAHSSLDKAIELLGLGADNYRKIPSRGDHTIDLDALRASIAADRAAGLVPFCIVGNAGTVNTGAIDPLADLAAIAVEGDLWFHVDGAYGGLARSVAAKRSLYDGLELADSIALDYHKWLYQPYEVGCTLVRDWDVLRRTYYKTAEYLEFGIDDDRFDISRHHFDLSRNAKAFKVWMSFKAYGAEAFAAMIAKDIELAEYLAARIIDSEDFELAAAGPLAIVCFRVVGNDGDDPAAIDRANAALLRSLEQDGRVFITGTVIDGRQVLRACIINHRMERADIDYLLMVIREVAGNGNAR